VSDRSDTGFSGEVLLGLKTCAIVAEFDQDLGRVHTTGAGKRHQESSVVQSRYGALEQRRDSP